MVGSMDFQRPSSLLDSADERTRVSIRRRLACEVQRILANSAEAQRRRHAAVAGARGRVRCEATVGARKRHDRRARVLQALAEECWRDPQGVGGLRSGKVENLAQRRTRADAAGPGTGACRACIQSSLLRSAATARRPAGPSDDRPSARSSAKRSKVTCRRSTGLFFTSRM